MCTVVIFAFIHRTPKFKSLQIYSTIFKLLPISLNYWYIYTIKYISRSFCATIPQRITVFFVQLFHNVLQFFFVQLFHNVLQFFLCNYSTTYYSFFLKKLSFYFVVPSSEHCNLSSVQISSQLITNKTLNWQDITLETLVWEMNLFLRYVIYIYIYIYIYIHLIFVWSCITDTII